MIYLVSVALLASLILNGLLIDRWVKLGRVVLGQEQDIEECLDGLNDVYANVGKILRLPLATNDPKVAQIHRELKRAHDFVLVVANRLASGWSDHEEGDTGDTDVG